MKLNITNISLLIICLVAFFSFTNLVNAQKPAVWGRVYNQFGTPINGVPVKWLDVADDPTGALHLHCADICDSDCGPCQTWKKSSAGAPRISTTWNKTDELIVWRSDEDGGPYSLGVPGNGWYQFDPAGDNTGYGCGENPQRIYVDPTADGKYVVTYTNGIGDPRIQPDGSVWFYAMNNSATVYWVDFTFVPNPPTPTPTPTPTPIPTPTPTATPRPTPTPTPTPTAKPWLKTTGGDVHSNK